MGMFDQLGKKQEQQQTNPRQMVQEIKSNPFNYLKEKGYNIPTNMNDPGSIMNYLMQTGQIGNQRMQMAQQILQRMMSRR